MYLLPRWYDIEHMTSVLLFSFNIENVFRAIILDDTVAMRYAVLDLTIPLLLHI